MKKLLSIFLTVACLLGLFCGCGEKEVQDAFSSQRLTIYFLDVGQADCSLLLFPDNTVALIDAGNKQDGNKVAEYIKGLGVKTINYFVLTHPHEDHIGGAVDIFKEFKVEMVCMPAIGKDYLPDTAVYKNTMDAVAKEKCRELYLNSSTAIVEKEDYSITALSPAKNSIFSDMNDYSLTLLVNCFSNTILFTGDAEKPAELDMMNSGLNLDADILKVGHHGSGNSSTTDFLKKVTPQVSIISCGKGNSYGHPHSDAIDRLIKSGSKVYRTDTVGTIIAKCYDGGFNIETHTDIKLDGNK